MTPESEQKLIEDVGAIKRAVLGEEATGHRGLVKEMMDLKMWQAKINLRIATVSGICVGAAFILKYLLNLHGP